MPNWFRKASFVQAKHCVRLPLCNMRNRASSVGMEYSSEKPMIINSCKSWIRGCTTQIHCFKKKQPCPAGLVRTALSSPTSHEQVRQQWSLDGITESDVEDAAPEIFIIDASGMEAINIEWTSDFQNSLALTEHSPYICYCYSFWTVTESFVLHTWLFLKKKKLSALSPQSTLPWVT